MKKYERLQKQPIPGETYHNAGSQYILKEPVRQGLAMVTRVKDGYTFVAHGPALYLIDENHVELQWDYSTGGHFAKS